MSGNNTLIQYPICSKHFEENGDRIPLLLKCSHTFCKVCVDELIDCQLVQFKNTINCYQCGKFQRIPAGSKELPINKYILPYIRKKNDDICTEHQRVATFFCKDVQCGKGICPTRVFVPVFGQAQFMDITSTIIGHI